MFIRVSGNAHPHQDLGTAGSGGQIHGYNTRHANNYCLLVHNHTFTENTTSYVAPVIANLKDYLFNKEVSIP